MRRHAVWILGGIALLVVISLAALKRTDTAPPPVLRGEAMPASAELRRCRSLGVAAQQDAGCREAWWAARRRFLQTGEGGRHG